MSTNAVFELHPGIVMKGNLSMTKDIVLTGRFEGDLKTLGRLTVAAGGAVIGSIEAGSLVLENGNHVQARVKVGVSVQPKVFSEARKSQNPKWVSPLQKLKEMAMGRK